MTDESQPNAHHWVFDWDKIRTIADIKAILICAECRPNPDHHSFYIIKDLCKQIDSDGKRIEQEPTAPATPPRTWHLWWRGIVESERLPWNWETVFSHNRTWGKPGYTVLRHRYTGKRRRVVED